MDLSSSESISRISARLYQAAVQASGDSVVDFDTSKAALQPLMTAGSRMNGETRSPTSNAAFAASHATAASNAARIFADWIRGRDRPNTTVPYTAAQVSDTAELDPNLPGMTLNSDLPNLPSLAQAALKMRQGLATKPPCHGHAVFAAKERDRSGTASDQLPPIDQLRAMFPALQQRINGHPLAWFDNAATTQKPQTVIQALVDFYENDNSNIHRAAHTMAARATAHYESARETVAKFLGAMSPEEIVFVRGTTEAINLAASILGTAVLKPGDEILLTELEHHANIVPWQMTAKLHGAQIRVAPLDAFGAVDLDAFSRLLNPRTKIVAISHASNSLGSVQPIRIMTALAKSAGAHVLIDGAQSVSHMPVNVRDIGCDFFAFSGHKVFGPTGIGALYIAKEIHERLPPWQGGGNMIRDVTFAETRYAEAPAKFEAGTPNIADAVGLARAIEFVTALGLESIGRREQSLLNYAVEGLQRIRSVQLIGRATERVAVQSFVIPGIPPTTIAEHLDRAGIAVRAGHHCAQPSLRRYGVEATVRPSFAFYNTTDEIDRMLEVLSSLAHRSQAT